MKRQAQPPWTAARMMRYDGIIFDVDGVLVEPTDPQVHRDAVRAALESFGVQPIDTDTVERLVEITGDNRDQLSAASVEEVCRRHGIDPEAFWRKRERLAAEAQVEELQAGRKERYPDASIVSDLGTPREPIALAAISNNQDLLLPRVLRAHDLLDDLAAVYGREPTLAGLERRKPAPHYPKRVMAELEMEDPLVVGDSEVDIETAERLELDSVFVRRPHRRGYSLQTAPDYEIESLTDLPAILNRA